MSALVIHTLDRSLLICILFCTSPFLSSVPRFNVGYQPTIMAYNCKGKGCNIILLLSSFQVKDRSIGPQFPFPKSIPGGITIFQLRMIPLLTMLVRMIDTYPCNNLLICFTCFQSKRASLLAMWRLPPPVLNLLIFSSYITYSNQVYKGLPHFTI